MFALVAVPDVGGTFVNTRWGVPADLDSIGAADGSKGEGEGCHQKNHFFHKEC